MRDLRTTHLYFAAYVSHILPPFNNFSIIQTEHTRASRLDNPGAKGHFLVETKLNKGPGRILDTFFQMSQVCFQLRERCLELMGREGQSVSMRAIHYPPTLHQPHFGPTRTPHCPPARCSEFVGMTHGVVPQLPKSSVSRTELDDTGRQTLQRDKTGIITAARIS